MSACRILLLMLASSLPASPYSEPFRPQFHFSPQENWTNDPNGLVYFEGEYHLFFQYNPFGDVWGHMSWGHAVSRICCTGSELPVALPEENGVMIFTGSTVVDEQYQRLLHATASPAWSPSIPATRPASGPRAADAKPRLQQRSRPHLDEIFRQSGARI